MGLEELANKGVRKYKRKIDTMKTSYERAKDRAIKHYKDIIPGPTRQKNYEDAWPDMITSYKEVMSAAKADKWKENWIAKMRE